MRESRIKIALFISTVFTAVLIIGSIMHFVEGDINPGFDNIPHSIYWAIVTLTTVGYGDVVPMTYLGKFLASTLMLLGYAIIAVPTGIVTSEMIKGNSATGIKEVEMEHKKCHNCGLMHHQVDAFYCRHCGSML
jgi:voltage-gated potassium channel